MIDLTYTIETAAVVASAAYGVLLARTKKLDFVGVFAVAFATAFGGGTLRDLFLDRHPLFWIKHDEFTIIVFGLALLTSFFKALPRRLRSFLVVPDALGLGLFSVLGTTFALEAGTSVFIAVLLGVITGTFGGVIADVMCNNIPSLFTSAPLYATCSFVGCWVYVATVRLVPEMELIAVLAGVLTIFLSRLAAVRWNLRLPNHS